MPKIPTGISAIQTGLGSFGVEDASMELGVKKLNPLKGQKGDNPKDVEKAVNGFEALLLQQMMKSMFETVDKTGLLGEDSNQADIMQGMFTQAVADEIAEGQGIGVKEVVKRELARKEANKPNGSVE